MIDDDDDDDDYSSYVGVFVRVGFAWLRGPSLCVLVRVVPAAHSLGGGGGGGGGGGVVRRDSLAVATREREREREVLLLSFFASLSLSFPIIFFSFFLLTTFLLFFNKSSSLLHSRKTNTNERTNERTNECWKERCVFLVKGDDDIATIRSIDRRRAHATTAESVRRGVFLRVSRRVGRAQLLRAGFKHPEYDDDDDHQRRRRRRRKSRRKRRFDDPTESSSKAEKWGGLKVFRTLKSRERMSARVGQTSGTNEEETTPLTIGEDDGMTRADDESYVERLPKWFSPKRLLCLFCLVAIALYVDRGVVSSAAVSGQPPGGNDDQDASSNANAERIRIARRVQRRLRRVRRVTIGVCDWFIGWRTGVFGVITKRQRVYVDSYWFGCVTRLVIWDAR